MAATTATIIGAVLGAGALAHGKEQSRMMQREAKKQQEQEAQQNAKMESELATQKKNESVDKQNFLLRMASQKRAKAAMMAGKGEGSSALTSNVGTQASGGKTLLGQ